MSVTTAATGTASARTGLKALANPALAIQGPKADAWLFWGAPVWAFVLCVALGLLAARLADPAGPLLLFGAAIGVNVLTSAHLLAVVPRSHLNPTVFNEHKFRFTVVPVLVFVAMATWTPVLVAGAVLAVFWDVYHSSMQTFGIGRIYDMKAGNPPDAGRRLDRMINLALYAGPIAAGASLFDHVSAFDDFGQVGMAALTHVPEVVEGTAGAIRLAALGAMAIAIVVYLVGYAALVRQGYRVSAHKVALLACTGLVSILAWGFAPALLAFMVANLFHAVQYFAMVWLKEGARITKFARLEARRAGRAVAFAAFLAVCCLFGIGYSVNEGIYAWPLALFITVSLMHFWYDSFVWSVRKKQV